MTQTGADENRSHTPIRVPFYDTDAMGVVHHAHYLRYFENGRVEWFRGRGIGYNRWLGTGLHLAVVETHVRYRSAARFDEVLVIETSLVEVKAATLRFFYKIVEEESGRLVAEGETVHACVGDDIRPKRLPRHVRAALQDSLRDPSRSP